MGRKVLVIVDVQNDFVNGGVLEYVYPEKINTEAICDLAEEFLGNGDYIIATRDTHEDDYLETLEGKMLPVKHCVRNTRGWNLIDRLDRMVCRGELIVVDKLTFSSLDLIKVIGEIQRSEGVLIDEIHIVGFCTSICVASNAIILRAQNPDMKIVLHKDLCGDINKDSHEAALTVLKNQQIEIV